MKKKFIGMCVCVLFLVPLVSSGTFQNDATTSNHSVTKKAMIMQVPLVTSLKNNLIPIIELRENSHSNKRGDWEQQAKLLASDGEAEDYFSSLGVSLSGDTAVIGAWGDDDLGVDAGSVYVFTRTGDTWTQQAKLLASDGGPGDAFGWCTAIQEDTVFIGAAGDTGMRGSVYVFTRTGTLWTEEAKLLASDGAIGDQFGYCISLFGDTALIGANCDDDNGFDSGSAYIFTYNDDMWTQQAKLLSSDGASLDSFGGEVSLSGDTALIGSCFDDDNGFDSGSAYVFLRAGTSWTQQAKLLASDGSPSDYFSAYAVSLSRDTAVIGALGDDDNGADSGSMYIFTRSGTTWMEHSKLLPADGAAQDYFGESVSLFNDTILCGAGGGDDAGSSSGSAYVFRCINDTWTQDAKLLPLDGSTGDVFGWVVALQNDTALIGAYHDDENGVDSGSTYVFIKDTNQPPLVEFSWTPSHPTIDQPILFDASASQDPDGIIIRYEWDWDSDGVYDENQTTSTVTHSWPSIGSYAVTVRVTDDDETNSTMTKTVEVGGVVNFTVDINGGIGVTAVITNTGSINATDIHWMVTLTGGVIFYGATKNGRLISIASNASFTIKDRPVIGFGKTMIQVNVSCAEGTSVTASATGVIFLFFVLGVK